MFERYEIRKMDREEVLYLYVNHDYEFGILDSVRETGKNLIGEINQYIQDRKIRFRGKKVALVVNGILVTSLLVASNYPDFVFPEKPNGLPTLSITEVLLPDKKEELPSKEEQGSDGEEIVDVEDEVTENVENELVMEDTNSSINSNSSTNLNMSKPSTDTGTSKPSTGTSSPSISTPNETPVEESTPVVKPEAPSTPTSPEDPYTTGIGIPVTVIRSNGTIIQLALEDYVIGVVAAEMPASFSIEALKAQAVAARTYVLKKIKQNQTVTDTIQDQVYKDVDQLKKEWGNGFTTYYNKVKQAVLDTQGKAIYYHNQLIDAVYFSTSNGRTEDAKEVWGNAFSYLVSVDSPWDVGTREYLKTVVKSRQDVSNRLGIELSEDTPIEVLERSSGNRIVTIKIGTQIFRGVDLYNKLGLRSRDFDMWVEGDSVYFTTRGWGHGVGMSQYGANGMAKAGYRYDQILTHYYQGVTIK